MNLLRLGPPSSPSLAINMKFVCSERLHFQTSVSRSDGEITLPLLLKDQFLLPLLTYVECNAQCTHLQAAGLVSYSASVSRRRYTTASLLSGVCSDLLPHRTFHIDLHCIVAPSRMASIGGGGGVPKEVSETALPWNCCAATAIRDPETFSKMAAPSTGPAEDMQLRTPAKTKSL